MADKKYVSIINNGSVALYLRDAEARQEINNLKTSMTGAMHYIGQTSTVITDGSTQPRVTADGIKYDIISIDITLDDSTLETSSYCRYSFGDSFFDNNQYYAWKSANSYYPIIYTDTLDLVAQPAPVSERSTVYIKEDGLARNVGKVEDIYNPTSSEYVELQAGSTVIYQNKEYVWNGASWNEFGSTGSLKALAFKDSATGSLTAAGSNAASAVTLTGGSTSKLATTSITPVSGTETVSDVSSTSSKLATTSIKGVAGTESVSKVTKTSSKLVTTTITGVGGSSTVHDTPTLTKTSITPVGGTGTVHDTPTLTKSSIGSASGWSAGSLPSMLYNEATETLTFGAGSLPSLTVTSTQVGTGLTAGTEKTFATAGAAVQVGTGLTAGTEKTFATAASSSTTVATGAASAEGSGADIVTGVSITDKTVATAASSNTIVATGATSDTGSGAAIVTSVTATDKTVAKAGTAVTVATGSVAANGGGATVVTASPTGGTAAAQTFTGSAVSVTVS